jgi:hypothetical protein
LLLVSCLDASYLGILHIAYISLCLRSASGSGGVPLALATAAAYVRGDGYNWHSASRDLGKVLANIIAPLSSCMGWNSPG